MSPRDDQQSPLHYFILVGLTHKNYFKWSQIVDTLLKVRGKQSHITGGPTEDDPKFIVWDEEDAMIKAIR